MIRLLRNASLHCWRSLAAPIKPSAHRWLHVVYGGVVAFVCGGWHYLLLGSLEPTLSTAACLFASLSVGGVIWLLATSMLERGERIRELERVTPAALK